MPKPVCLIAAGGTFDKRYPETKGSYAFEFAETPGAVRIAARASVRFAFVLRADPPKDSLDMNDEDREAIAGFCEKVRQDAIVVTHGTDTMIQTAQIVASLEPLRKKTIVLTGAAQPECMKETDADFNVGFAYCAAQHLSPGVYIAMNGIIFSHDNCQKNDDGTFTVRT